MFDEVQDPAACNLAWAITEQ